jgi:hypothetical protein
MHEASWSPGVPASAQRIDGHKLQWPTAQDSGVVDEPGQRSVADFGARRCQLLGIGDVKTDRCQTADTHPLGVLIATTPASTEKPPSRRCSAIASPMPLDAPVTMTSPRSFVVMVRVQRGVRVRRPRLVIYL